MQGSSIVWIVNDRKVLHHHLHSEYIATGVIELRGFLVRVVSAGRSQRCSGF